MQAGSEQVPLLVRQPLKKISFLLLGHKIFIVSGDVFGSLMAWSSLVLWLISQELPYCGRTDANAAGVRTSPAPLPPVPLHAL